MSASNSPRLIMVSNRLPMSVSLEDGQLSLSPSVGGLATGLSSFYRAYDSRWIGWPGLPEERLIGDINNELEEKLACENCLPVSLSAEDFECYYEGFSNNTVWPLFHYFPEYVIYKKKFWECYRRVNQRFADKVIEQARPGDVIWIHDYHLMLLPGLIREKMPEATIGFFLHIPFPAFEIFRLLPQREEVLRGLMGADLIGFHTYDYVRGLLDSARRLAGVEHTMGRLMVDTRMVKADAFPMGIDVDRFAEASTDPKVREQVADIRWQAEGRRIVLSIDRLDYTKGIIERLKAFEDFLEAYPEDVGKVSLILLVVPSRTAMDQYADMKRQVDELVGQINGKYGTIGFVPIWYLYRSLPFHKVVGLYSIADVAMVTPLRDGMNLVAKEYVATKTDGKGVLVLSEMAGSAQELSEALIVNPNNTEEVAAALKKGLDMPPDEQKERLSKMQARLERYNITEWAQDFLDSLGEVKQLQNNYAVAKLSSEDRDTLVAEYHQAKHRLFLFDYDGTLAPFVDRPEDARPDERLVELLGALAADDRNQVVIVSNRDRYTLGEWLGDLPIDLVAEHGYWAKPAGKDWTLAHQVTSDWKDDFRPILEAHMDRTPGSFIEEKDFTLVWHYRLTDQALAAVRSQELKDHLLHLTATLDVEILDGNKTIMVKPAGMNKGLAASRYIQKGKWDFILSAGDDWTDEDMFKALPPYAYSLRVGLNVTQARFNLNSPADVRRLLAALTS